MPWCGTWRRREASTGAPRPTSSDSSACSAATWSAGSFPKPSYDWPMSNYQYESAMGVPAADAPAVQRLEFIRKTYAHLGGAVLAFAALEALLFQSGLAEQLTFSLVGSRMG